MLPLTDSVNSCASHDLGAIPRQTNHGKSRDQIFHYRGEHQEVKMLRSQNLRIMAIAMILFTSCKKTSSPSTTVPEAEALAGDIVLALLVEHEPDEYPSELRRQAQNSIPRLAAAYTGCASEQKEAVR